MIRFLGSFLVLVFGLAIVGTLLGHNLLGDFKSVMDSLFNFASSKGHSFAPTVSHALHKLHAPDPAHHHHVRHVIHHRPRPNK